MTPTTDPTNLDTCTPDARRANDSRLNLTRALREAAELIEGLQGTEADLRRQLAEARARCQNYFRAQLKLVEDLAVLEDELEATRESRDAAEDRCSLLEGDLRCSRHNVETMAAHRGIDWAAARLGGRVS